MAKNGKVTIAVIGEQIKHLTQKLDEIHADVRGLRVDQARNGAEIANLKDDYGGLTMRVNAWSTLNSIGVAIAAIVGSIFGKK